MLISEHTATIEACRFCFMCRHVCTAGVVSGRESDTPRGRALILFKALKGHIDYCPDTVETLYRCCLCGLCETWCQAGCSPPRAVLAARADVVARGLEPEKVRQLRDRLLATGNPFGLPADDRFRQIGAADRFRPGAEVLYYVGCDAAYRQPQIARAMLRILDAAGVDYALLRGECSTGKPLLVSGYRQEAGAMAAKLAAEIRSQRPRVLVTTCPSALDAFTADYPAMGLELSGIEVLHAAQYVDRLMEQGMLVPRAARADATAATFLDGTYLGRVHGLYDEPRRVLGRLPDLQVREMGWSRKLAYSAGEPGGIFPLLQPQLSQAMARRVLAEASTTGAGLLITTCPATLGTLQEAAAGTDWTLRDLVEVVADAL